MEIDRLSRFNEWWNTGSVRKELLQEKKRPQFPDMLKQMEKRHILLITGLRRVGKTTIMYQLIQALLEMGVGSSKIIYFSFDDQSVEVDDMLRTYEEKVLKAKLGGERVYIFLDEIQKLKDWQNRVKIYYDLYPKIKLIISGSASVQISRKANESLAGRIAVFHMRPLSFSEFLDWKNIKIAQDNLELSQGIALPAFNDYLRKGGFPELIEENEDGKIRNYVKNSIIDRIVYKDLPEEFQIRDTELLRTLIDMISANPGMLLNYDALSREFGRSKVTLMNYVEYLEYSLLIRKVANYRKGFRISSRKLKKIYPGNTAISFANADSFYSDKFMEKVYESFAVIDSDAMNYYRNRYEVDIILKIKGRILPIEVKYGSIDIESTKKFLEEAGLDKAYMLTKGTFSKSLAAGLHIEALPLWAFSLTKESILGKLA